MWFSGITARDIEMHCPAIRARDLAEIVALFKARRISLFKCLICLVGFLSLELQLYSVDLLACDGSRLDFSQLTCQPRFCKVSRK